MFLKDSRGREQERSALAAAGGKEKRAYVRAMFSDIAPSYDLLNRLLSFGIDRYWRRRAISALECGQAPAGVYLDLCAGTLDVSAALTVQPGFGGAVVGADLAEPMLRAGRRKGRWSLIHPVVADALALPLSNQSCDGAVAAFGVRNLSDLDSGFTEVNRVLRPGARFVILEFATPRSAIVRAVYHAYFRRVLPLIGGWISGNRTAYRYLPESVAHFPSPRELAECMRDAGFERVEWETLTLGIVTLHVGIKR